MLPLRVTVPPICLRRPLLNALLNTAARRIERVLWNDPATGVMRHADAGYAKAIEVAKARGVRMPMLR